MCGCHEYIAHLSLEHRHQKLKLRNSNTLDKYVVGGYKTPLHFACKVTVAL